MISTVKKLKEKLSKYPDNMKVRILDISDDSGESGVYDIIEVEENKLIQGKSEFGGNEKEIDVLTINFKQ